LIFPAMWAVVKEGIENEESILWSSYICNNELILRFILLENEKCCGRSKGRR
jgi:hypothetical protein